MYKGVVAWQFADPLGAENRVRLPRCVTCRIRREFSNPCCREGCDYWVECERAGHYTGFLTAEESRALREANKRKDLDDEGKGERSKPTDEARKLARAKASATMPMEQQVCAAQPGPSQSNHSFVHHPRTRDLLYLRAAWHCFSRSTLLGIRDVVSVRVRAGACVLSPGRSLSSR